MRPEMPRLGHIGALESQPGIREGTLAWTRLAVPIYYVDLGYQVSGGAEHGRDLTGAVRTFLEPGDTTWTTIEALSTSHLVDRALFDSYAANDPSEMIPVWERIVVTVDGTRMTARYSICNGYEAVAFRAGDRVVSSVFSVFDASGINSAFRTFIWPLRA